MKKQTFLLIIATIVMLFAATAQTNEGHPNGHDSDVVNASVNAAIDVANVVTGRKPLIPFLSDEYTGGIVSGIIFFFWRLIERRRLRKAGRLLDKNKNGIDDNLEVLP